MKISQSEAKRLVVSYEKFIRKTIKEFQNKCPPSLEPDDLFEEGIVGLLKAVDISSSWNEFSSRVENKIRDEVELAIRVELYSVKLGQDIGEDFAEYRKVLAMLFQQLHRSPTLDEIAAKTTLPNEKLEGLENLYRTALDYDEE